MHSDSGIASQKDNIVLPCPADPTCKESHTPTLLFYDCSPNRFIGVESHDAENGHLPSLLSSYFCAITFILILDISIRRISGVSPRISASQSHRFGRKKKVFYQLVHPHVFKVVFLRIHSYFWTDGGRGERRRFLLIRTSQSRQNHLGRLEIKKKKNEGKV